jgi:hypothetical protein
VGLVLNLERVRYQRAVEVLLGVVGATSNRQLATIWFDAIADVPERVAALRDEVNAQRAEARAMSRRGLNG